MSLCPVCASDTYEIANSKAGYTILRCRSCRLVFADPMPSDADLTAYYQGFKYSAPDPAKLAWQINHTQRGARRIVQIANRLHGGVIQDVLDFGGGLGFFASGLAESYPDVTLFDLDSEARTFARDTFGPQFKIAETELEALSRKYDLILINQVIEHVVDPVGFLARIGQCLKSNGLLVVTTPNNKTNDFLFRPEVLIYYSGVLKASRADSFRKMATDSWLCCDPPRHLFAFDQGNLNLVAEHAGLLAVQNETAYFDEDPFGQPKYWPGSFKSRKEILRIMLSFFMAAVGPIAHMIDPSRNRGSTLVGYYKLKY